MFDVSFLKIIRRDNKASKESIIYPITSIALSMWEEHCVECSVPFCYTSCKMYEKRYDGWCVRCEDGLVRNYNYRGLYDYGIQCKFKKWAKLETKYYPKAFSVNQYKTINRINVRITDILAACYGALPKSKLLTKYIFRPYQFLFRNWWLGHQHATGWRPDYFLCACYLNNKDSVQLLLQMDNDDGIVYSRTFKLKEGFNELLIPIEDINVSGLSKGTRVYVTPLNEDTVTDIVFTYLNFVQMPLKKKIPLKPATKVKVVVWDLDNTLWTGTLVEDGADKIKIREETVRVIKELDKRGILNSICSKNNHDDAMQAVENFGLSEYFLSPAINWGQKSENIKSIAKRLNLGLDSFAFIDDNIREREEVASALPCIRVYDEKSINQLLYLTEFDVPVSPESAQRRLSYINEQKREAFKATYTDGYDNFLRGLSMKLQVFSINEGNRKRSLELLQRTNQLNLRTLRYSEDAFGALIRDVDYKCFAFNCEDKFGDYGQVGFMSVHIAQEEASIKDFVISCRIAKKKVEEAMLYAVVATLPKNIRTISADFVKTEKNKPLEDVLNILPFKKTEMGHDVIHYESSNRTSFQNPGIISIVYSL